MKAIDYVSFCKSAALELIREFKKLGIEFEPQFGSYYDKYDCRVMAFLHPDDLYKRHYELKYPFRDI